MRSLSRSVSINIQLKKNLAKKELQDLVINNLKVINNEQENHLNLPNKTGRFRKSIIAKRAISKDYISNLLKKNKNQRTLIENHLIADYLNQYFTYFKKIKESDSNQLEKIVSVLNCEQFNSGENIINYGEDGEKFYIVFSGEVSVYKPVFIEKVLSVFEYYRIMCILKQKNYLKYNRIFEKNKYLNINFDKVETLSPDNYFNRQKYCFLFEEEECMGNFRTGFSFGEIALIKRTKRNATIRCRTNVECIVIEKNDYNKIMRELEEKRLEIELLRFKLDFRFFENWTNNMLINLFNCQTHITLTKDQYLYKQDDEADSVYLLIDGCFEEYCYISHAWVNNFLDYIKDSRNNLIYRLEVFKPKKEKDIHDLFDYCKQNELSSPFIYKNNRPNPIYLSNIKEENIVEVKKKEDNLYNNPLKLFKVKIRDINIKSEIGIIDSFEFKKRFSFVKCVSQNAKLSKVKIYELIKIMAYNREENSRKIMMDLIAEKKSLFSQHIKKNIQINTLANEKDFEGKYKIILDKNSKTNDKNKLKTLNLLTNSQITQNNNIINRNEYKKSSHNKVRIINDQNLMYKIEGKNNDLTIKMKINKESFKNIQNFFKIKSITNSQNFSPKSMRTIESYSHKKNLSNYNFMNLNSKTIEEKKNSNLYMTHKKFNSTNFYFKNYINKTEEKNIKKLFIKNKNKLSLKSNISNENIPFTPIKKNKIFPEIYSGKKLFMTNDFRKTMSKLIHSNNYYDVPNFL